MCQFSNILHILTTLFLMWTIRIAYIKESFCELLDKHDNLSSYDVGPYSQFLVFVSLEFASVPKISEKGV